MITSEICWNTVWKVFVRKIKVRKFSKLKYSFTHQTPGSQRKIIEDDFDRVGHVTPPVFVRRVKVKFTPESTVTSAAISGAFTNDREIEGGRLI